MIYTYTLNMKSGYNCEVDVDHVPMDEEYWSTFGKTDRIVMRDCGTDRIYIWPNYTFYGYDTYTGEGKVWGFFCGIETVEVGRLRRTGTVRADGWGQDCGTVPAV